MIKNIKKVKKTSQYQRYLSKLYHDVSISWYSYCIVISPNPITYLMNINESVTSCNILRTWVDFKWSALARYIHWYIFNFCVCAVKGSFRRGRRDIEELFSQSSFFKLCKIVKWLKPTEESHVNRGQCLATWVSQSLRSSVSSLSFILCMKCSRTPVTLHNLKKTSTFGSERVFDVSFFSEIQ